MRHSEWAEEDHLKSAARFCWWGKADPPSRRLAVRAERGRRQQRHAAPPVARCAAPPGQALGSRQLLAGAGSLRAVCGSASSPQTHSSAPDGRRAPLARAAVTFLRLQKVSSLPACGITTSAASSWLAAGWLAMVPRRGLEPPWMLLHQPLKLARLPISPPGH